LGSSTKVGG
jgi:hypothetical protein